MAKKRETVDTGPLLTSLQRLGWFRKINDTVQIGIPDIIGCFDGTTFGIEVKSIKEVPEGGIVPPSSAHTFSAKQVHDLQGIWNAGGVGVGLVICGKVAAIFTPDQIDKNGQVNWMEARAYINKEKGEWILADLLWMRKTSQDRS